MPPAGIFPDTDIRRQSIFEVEKKQKFNLIYIKLTTLKNAMMTSKINQK